MAVAPQIGSRATGLAASGGRGASRSDGGGLTPEKRSAASPAGEVEASMSSSQQKKAERRRTQQEALRRYHGEASRWIDDIPDAPVFRPTAEEFADPLAYICKIQEEVHEWGICKIIPPLSAAVPGSTVLLEQGPFSFTTRQQVVRKPVLSSLDKLQFFASGKTYSIVNYEKAANEFSYRRYNMASGLPARFVEAEYWREWHGGANLCVEYGNDVEGSAFSCEEWDPLAASRWNFKSLPVEQGSILRHLQVAIPGITAPMLYIGMLFSTFGWHVEDQYMHSINFHHYGAPKTWYGVPSSHADRFEEVVMDQVYSGTKEARSLPRCEYAKEAVKAIAGKATMFPPHHLMAAGVRVCRCVQQAGEFVVTYPRAYHGGFSNGYNCGEAVNFATPEWFPFGLAATTRYSMLNLQPIMSVEALLCVEARLLAERQAASGAASSDCGDPQQQAQEAVIKRSLCRLMVWQNDARRTLVQDGAACHRMPGDKTLLLPCCQCSQLCYLAAVLHAASVYSGKALCLRCALEGRDAAAEMTIMCQPEVEASEALAKRWARWADEATAVLGGQETPLGDDARSQLLAEPPWWEASGETPGNLADHQWLAFPGAVGDAPQGWLDILNSLSSSSGGTSSGGRSIGSVGEEAPADGSKEGKPSGSARKTPKRRRPPSTAERRKKATKGPPKIGSWASAIQSGTTGDALGCALERDSPEEEPPAWEDAPKLEPALPLPLPLPLKSDPDVFSAQPAAALQGSPLSSTATLPHSLSGDCRAGKGCSPVLGAPKAGQATAAGLSAPVGESTTSAQIPNGGANGERLKKKRHSLPTRPEAAQYTSSWALPVSAPPEVTAAPAAMPQLQPPQSPNQAPAEELQDASLAVGPGLVASAALQGLRSLMHTHAASQGAPQSQAAVAATHGSCMDRDSACRHFQQHGFMRPDPGSVWSGRPLGGQGGAVPKQLQPQQPQQQQQQQQQRRQHGAPAAWAPKGDLLPLFGQPLSAQADGASFAAGPLRPTLPGSLTTRLQSGGFTDSREGAASLGFLQQTAAQYVPLSAPDTALSALLNHPVNPPGQDGGTQLHMLLQSQMAPDLGWAAASKPGPQLLGCAADGAMPREFTLADAMALARQQRRDP